jgi:hypothetical protein
VKPEITEAADEFFYTWQDVGLGLCFNRLRETDAGLVKGHLTIESTAPDRQGHVYWAYVTLSTSADRDRVTKKLQNVVCLEAGEWERQVDRCFQDVAQRFLRVPEPGVLADVELDESRGYLFAPVLPFGQVTELMADQGVSKSYLLLYLAVCTAAGVDSIFGPPARTGPVIYYDWETDAGTQRRRLEWICRGLGLPAVPRDIHYLNMGGLGRLIDRVREMRSQVARLEPALILVDSLTFATGGDLNSTELAGPTMVGIGSLGEGVTKCVAAHYAKGHREGNGPASVMGSGLFEFKARSLWEMRKEQDAGSEFNVAMIYRKLSDGPQQQPLAYRIAFDNAARLVRFSGARVEDSAELSQRGLSVAHRIRLLLRSKRNSKCDTAEMAEALNVPAADIRANLSRMADVVRLSEGKGRGHASVWGLTDRPDAKAQSVTPLRERDCHAFVSEAPNGAASENVTEKRNVTDYKAQHSRFPGDKDDEPEPLPW